MVHPGGKLRPGRVVHVAPGFEVRILETTERRTRIVRLSSAELPVAKAIERFGHVPLPPYVRRGDEAADAERYQTVFARERGSVAAPTAGLHFTAKTFEKLRERGIEIADLTLAVGSGTFKPVTVEDTSEHRLEAEEVHLPAATVW